MAKNDLFLASLCHRGKRFWFAFLLYVFVLVSHSTYSQSSNPNEDIQVPEGKAKAVFILNIVRYTVWPKSAFTGPNAPFVIGVLGENHFGNEFNELTKRTVLNRPISVKPCSAVEEAKQCHLVFVTSSEKARLREILAELKKSEVMTIGETESFTNLGGAINLTREKNQVRCEISRSATTGTKFRVSSQLFESSLFKSVR